MMKARRQSALAGITIILTVAGFESSAAADDFDTCAKSSGDVAITVCTKAIGSDRYKDHILAMLYYDRGVAWHAKGDNDLAIADYSEAIRLDPKLASAYNNRGVAWHAKGDDDRAIADCNEAIRLNPKFADAYDSRGFVWRAKGDNDRAIADYNEAIRLHPKSAGAYRGRGAIHLYSGSLPKALADLNQATELDPKNVYGALWLDIASKRGQVASRLSQAIAQIDMTKWPAPVIRLFLGQLPPAAVLAAADSPDSAKKREQVCEANFYNGELALQQGAKEDATRLFQLAAADCPKNFDESWAAGAELKALAAAQ
jgi:lipoprotein NlpI